MPLVLDVELLQQGDRSLGKIIEYYQGKWIGARATVRLFRSAYELEYHAPLTWDLITTEVQSEIKAE